MGLGRIAAIAATLLVAGCATKSLQQISSLRTESGPTSIVLMPVDVELSELTAAGLLEPKADWTEAAREHFRDALRAEKEARGLRMVEYDEGKATPERLDELNQVSKLHGLIGQSILLHEFVGPFKLPTKQAGFDWSVGPAVRALKEQTGADYALFSFVRDSYASAGRAAMIVVGAVLGVGVPGGQQLGFVSLVDLNSGNVVWFNRLARGSGDMRSLEAARETAKTLLTGLPQ
jgi:hypothetical protein